MLTIDASVWVNADSPAEKYQPASRQLLDELFRRNISIVEPMLLPIEISAAISRTRADKNLAIDMATAILNLPLIKWVELDNSNADHAVQLAACHKLRGADAVYAQVAISHNCDLVSLDNEHLSRLDRVLKTITPSVALERLGEYR